MSEKEIGGASSGERRGSLSSAAGGAPAVMAASNGDNAQDAAAAAPHAASSSNQNNSGAQGTAAPPVASIALPSSAQVLSGFCDLCWGRDGYQGMALQRCKDCGVSFHNACYGMIPAGSNTSPNLVDPTIQCLACAAVGKKFHVRDRSSSTQKRIAIRVKERPTECCLCAVDNKYEWLHAMHPVYDDHGSAGRQIMLPKTKTKPRRLAWAHTLCCAVLCYMTSSLVYGCGADGTYEVAEQDEEQEVISDAESVNSALATEEDEVPTKGAGGSVNYRAAPHHYTLVLPKNKKRDRINRGYLVNLREFQKLKCMYCGKDDRPDHIYRIAVQCCANDDKEFEEFEGCHKDLRGKDCYVPQHVGCAIWKKRAMDEWPNHRHVFYWPGDDIRPNPVGNVFCSAHCLDLEKGKKDFGTKILRYDHLFQAKPATYSSDGQLLVARRGSAAARSSSGVPPAQKPQRQAKPTAGPATKPRPKFSTAALTAKIASSRSSVGSLGVTSMGRTKTLMKKPPPGSASAHTNIGGAGGQQQRAPLAKKRTREGHVLSAPSFRMKAPPPHPHRKAAAPTSTSRVDDGSSHMEPPVKKKKKPVVKIEESPFQEDIKVPSAGSGVNKEDGPPNEKQQPSSQNANSSDVDPQHYIDAAELYVSLGQINKASSTLLEAAKGYKAKGDHESAAQMMLAWERVTNGESS